MKRRISKRGSEKNVSYDVGQSVKINVTGIGIVIGVIKHVYNSSPIVYDVVSIDTNKLFTIESSSILNVI